MKVDKDVYSIVNEFAVEVYEKLEEKIVIEIQEIARGNKILTKVALNKKEITERLLKGEPVKVIRDRDYREYCSRCGKNLDYEFVRPNYCSECGQKLDWSK